MRIQSLLALVAGLLVSPVFATQLHLCSSLGAEGLIAGAKIEECSLRVERGGITIKIWAHHDGKGKAKREQVDLDPRTWKNIGKAAVRVDSPTELYGFIRFTPQQATEALAFFELLKSGKLDTVRLSGANTTFGLFESGNKGYEIEIRWGAPEDSVCAW